MKHLVIWHLSSHSPHLKTWLWINTCKKSCLMDEPSFTSSSWDQVRIWCELLDPCARSSAEFVAGWAILVILVGMCLHDLVRISDLFLFWLEWNDKFETPLGKPTWDFPCFVGKSSGDFPMSFPRRRTTLQPALLVKYEGDDICFISGKLYGSKYVWLCVYIIFLSIYQ